MLLQVKVFEAHAINILAHDAQVPNGEMTAEQARFLGGAVRKYGEKGCLDITTRANMQLRGIPLEDAGDIMNGLQSVGLTSVQTGKHVVLGSRVMFVWTSNAHDHLGSSLLCWF